MILGKLNYDIIQCHKKIQQAINRDKIIKSKPMLLCEYCFKEHCKGHGLTKIIKFLKRFF